MANRTNDTAANLGFEEKLWEAADNLRAHMDAAEYKHVVRGLIFLKYISDAFTEHYHQLELWTADPRHEYYVREPGVRYEVLEDRDEYTAENVFWVPREVRWSYLQAIATAARELVEKRDGWLNPEGASEKELNRRTLTNLHNQRPTWLDLAHQKLDRAVFDAYGWPHDLTDERILEHLLALNLQRAHAAAT
jgi:type I restriction-modification system DNA methylase subunit